VRAAPALPAALRLLADPVRLRILALLEREELAVGELGRALELSQSRVSNHLRQLREAGLLVERHVGTSTRVRLREAPGNHPGNHPGSPRGSDGGPAGLPRRLWETLRGEQERSPEHRADRLRLEQVLAERAGDGAIFDRLAGEWDKLAGAFQTGRARERTALSLLPKGLVVADLGCGTGYMGRAVLGLCERLILVDRSERMLEEAERRLGGAAGSTRLDVRRGELDALPIADGEVDAVLCGLVLHHLPTMEPSLAEVRRILRPGGTLAVLELAPHREAWMQAALGDLHLGLEPGDVLAALERAGFEHPVLEPVEDRYRPRRSDAPEDEPTPSLALYVARAEKPLDEPGTRSRDPR